MYLYVTSNVYIVHKGNAVHKNDFFFDFFLFVGLECKLIDEGGTHDVDRYTGLWLIRSTSVPESPPYRRCMQVSPNLLTHFSDGKLSSMTCEGSRMGHR